MRRRLDIAASIVVTPRLMFLDEPTTGLDPRSRNQVWDIVRALVGRRDDDPALHPVPGRGRPAGRPDRRHRPRPGHRRGHARPSSRPRSAAGTLHVRLLDADRRPDAAGGARARGRHGPSSRPTRRAVGVLLGRRPRGGTGVAELSRPGIGIADFSLGQPSLDEVFLALTGHPADEQAADDAEPTSRSSRHERRRLDRPSGAGRPPPSAAAISTTAAAAAGPGRLSHVLTFGWRGMLKVKHVPEQLLDVTRHAGDVHADVHLPVRRRDRRLDRAPTCDYTLPGLLVMSVLFTTVYSGRLAEHRPDQGRRRPVPVAADLAAGARCSARCSATVCGT